MTRVVNRGDVVPNPRGGGYAAEASDVGIRRSLEPPEIIATELGNGRAFRLARKTWVGGMLVLEYQQPEGTRLVVYV